MTPRTQVTLTRAVEAFVNLDHAVLRRNLEAVRTGAMPCDPGVWRDLEHYRLIRVNGKGWYDLTPTGRLLLAKLGGAS